MNETATKSNGKFLLSVLPNICNLNLLICYFFIRLPPPPSFLHLWCTPCSKGGQVLWRHGFQSVTFRSSSWHTKSSSYLYSPLQTTSGNWQYPVFLLGQASVKTRSPELWKHLQFRGLMKAAVKITMCRYNNIREGDAHNSLECNNSQNGR